MNRYVAAGSRQVPGFRAIVFDMRPEGSDCGRARHKWFVAAGNKG